MPRARGLAGGVQAWLRRRNRVVSGIVTAIAVQLRYRGAGRCGER